MEVLTTEVFDKGIYNIVGGENIPQSAAKDAKGWISTDDAIELCRGRLIVGTETGAAGSTGLHVAYKADGTEVFFRKAGTVIQYLLGSTWTDLITGLEATEIYTFTNYVSLAGNWVYIGGKSGLWKVPTANPGSFIDLYLAANNFKGKIRIDRSAMFLWGRTEDRTGLYRSKIDPQDGTVYTTVSAEAIGALGSTNYTGTLAFKAGGSRRSCFGVVFTATTASGTEVFTDNFSGTLTSNFGGTGTINYATGAYNITFASVTTGAVTSDYQWEDSATNGIADFRKSGTRVAGEGFIIRQDEGGDPIMTVLIQDGKYYSFKQRSIYELDISADDTTATNLPFRLGAGVSAFGAATESSIGIIFLNTANPDKPILTTLQRASGGSTLEPIVLAPQFDFSNYEWSNCWMDTYGEYVVFSGMTAGADNNNRVFLLNTRLNIVDVLGYDVNPFAKSNGILYVGSSVNYSVSKLLSGFDDDGLPVVNYWIGRDELFATTDLKKVKRLQFKGKIARDQRFEVYVDYDNAGFQLVGTIRGDQAYVDTTTSYAIGTVGIGQAAIGGDSATLAYDYYTELKLRRAPKFRKRTIKIMALGIGYVSIEKIADKDVRFFQNRLPSRYRLKQNVSLDGESTNQ